MAFAVSTIPTHSPDRILVSRTSLWMARLLWFVPALMLFLAVNQAKVAYDLRKTLRDGMPAIAEVTEYERVDRKDVTNAELSLRVRLPDGTEIVHEKMALPYTLSFMVEQDSLEVRVLPGADQEIVITSIAATQSRIAAINAAISLVGFLLFGAGVLWWNRYLRKKGDPALRAQPTPQA